jgi:hypothetical protein
VTSRAAVLSARTTPIFMHVSVPPCEHLGERFGNRRGSLKLYRMVPMFRA